MTAPTMPSIGSEWRTLGILVAAAFTLLSIGAAMDPEPWTPGRTLLYLGTGFLWTALVAEGWHALTGWLAQRPGRKPARRAVSGRHAA